MTKLLNQVEKEGKLQMIRNRKRYGDLASKANYTNNARGAKDKILGTLHSIDAHKPPREPHLPNYEVLGLNFSGAASIPKCTCHIGTHHHSKLRKSTPSLSMSIDSSSMINKSIDYLTEMRSKNKDRKRILKISKFEKFEPYYNESISDMRSRARSISQQALMDEQRANQLKRSINLEDELTADLWVNAIQAKVQIIDTI